MQNIRIANAADINELNELYQSTVFQSQGVASSLYNNIEEYATANKNTKSSLRLVLQQEYFLKNKDLRWMKNKKEKQINYL